MSFREMAVPHNKRVSIALLSERLPVHNFDRTLTIGALNGNLPLMHYISRTTDALQGSVLCISFGG